MQKEVATSDQDTPVEKPRAAAQVKFDTLKLDVTVQKGIDALGFEFCSPIQAQILPHTLGGNDAIGKAQTGTGKTAAFLVTIFNDLLSHPIEGERFLGEPRAVIIAPARELVMQIAEDAQELGKFTGLQTVTMIGGADYQKQLSKVNRAPVDLVVATPGRLIDFMERRDLALDRVEILVLDEADRMLDMGFIHDIKKIMKLLPERRQNLMFTATFSNSFRALAKEVAEKAIEISVTTDNETGANIEHYVHPVDKSRKAELLIELIETENWSQALVFTRTKHGADRLQKQLDKVGIKSQAIHGNKTQNNRMKALEAFKNNKIRILVATDVAARGIDIKKMSQVINFDVPTVAKDYVHRIGRTGRAGDKGKAITLVSIDEYRILLDIEKLLNQKLERVEIAGFEPVDVVPSKDNPPKSKKKFNNQGGYRKRTRNRKG